jgi:hypothetical protein
MTEEKAFALFTLYAATLGVVGSAVACVTGEWLAAFGVVIGGMGLLGNVAMVAGAVRVLRQR